MMSSVLIKVEPHQMVVIGFFSWSAKAYYTRLSLLLVNELHKFLVLPRFLSIESSSFLLKIPSKAQKCQNLHVKCLRCVRRKGLRATGVIHSSK